MPRVKLDSTKPHQTYTLKDKTVVPGVTSALAVMAKPALLKWAWEQGRAGLDFRQTSKRAADIGTVAHFIIECGLRGDQPDLSDYPKAHVLKAKTCADNFFKWWKSEGFQWKASEVQLVSERFRFGGTLDILAVKRGSVLIDIKTSKAIYDDYWYQVAAYEVLHNENFDRDIRAVHIVRIGKDGGAPEIQTRTDLEAEWRVFLRCLKLKQELDAYRR